MKEPHFRFNPKTLRYERVRFSLWRTLLAALSYASFGLLFFISLNFLQNFLIETAREKALTKENTALTEYKTVLASQLDESNILLSELKTEEDQLTEKLFEVPSEPTEPILKKENQLMAAGDSPFTELVSKLEAHLTSINAKAKKYNHFFSDRLHVKRSDVAMLLNLPSIAPVNSLLAENLVSGFGVRINPFHKGNYHHDGIDIALSKGSDVLAAGNGRVSYLSSSNLEAGFGNYIEIDHGNGIVTRYSHLEKMNVTWGQKVKQGQVIGLSGSSGGSVAPHLHYEVIKNGKNLDPLSFMVEGISSSQHQELALKSKIQNQSLD